jgi:hypothetical protein
VQSEIVIKTKNQTGNTIITSISTKKSQNLDATVAE